MQDFTQLRAWIAARDFFVDVYAVTKKFPREEQFGFTSQLRRAARSVAADIAEGSGYGGELDSARFYRMGFGSSSECYSDLHLARAVNLLALSDFDRLESKLLPARKQLSRLITSIETRNQRRPR
jgi:four helix bundle protein